MFRKIILKIYRKIARLESNYGVEVTDMMILGRLWYKVFTRPLIAVIKKVFRRSKAKYIVFDHVPDFYGNAKALYDYMIEQGINRRYKITWIVNEPEEYKKYKTKNVRFIRRYSKSSGRHTLSCYPALLKARYVFCRSTLRWIGGAKSQGQLYIGLGDGCDLLRQRIRKSHADLMDEEDDVEEEIINEEENTGVENISNEDNSDEMSTGKRRKREPKFDYYLVPSEMFVPAKQDVYHCTEDKLLCIGDARYNQFSKKRPEADLYFQKLTGKNANLKKIFWMPVYRKPSLVMRYQTNVASMMGLPMIHSIVDMPRFNELCKENQVHFVIYCNPDCETLYKEVGNLSHVSFISEPERREADVELYELLPKFDAMVSDYAAEAFDFLLLDKPVAYVLNDYEEIRRLGGFIVKDTMEYMPGEKIYSMDDMAKFMQHVAQGQDEYQAQRKEVCEKTHEITDDYCKRILDQFGIC